MSWKFSERLFNMDCKKRRAGRGALVRGLFSEVASSAQLILAPECSTPLSMRPAMRISTIIVLVVVVTILLIVVVVVVIVVAGVRGVSTWSPQSSGQRRRRSAVLLTPRQLSFLPPSRYRFCWSQSSSSASHAQFLGLRTRSYTRLILSGTGIASRVAH